MNSKTDVLGKPTILHTPRSRAEAYTDSSDFKKLFSAEKTSALLSPKRLLRLMVLSIFLSETAIMLIFGLIPPLHPALLALLDSTLLLIILSPTVYFFHYQPLQRHHRERMKIAQQLYESERRFQLTLQAVNDSLWDFNPQSGEIYVSPQSATKLGYQPGEIGSHIDDWKKLLHPDEVELFMKAKSDHLSGITDHLRFEHRLKAKDGKWFWFLSRGQIVARDAEGNPLRMVGTHTDITQRKEAEAALLRSEEEIRMLSHKLIHSSEEEKKRLAQDLHDEFGQVLIAFQLGLEMLRDQNSGQGKDHSQQCNRLLSMVQRLETDLKHVCDQLRPVILDDHGLVETIRWHIREFFQTTNAFQVDFQVNGDKKLSREATIVLYRIYQEALTNVRKHAQASEVKVKLDMLDNQVVLTVQDNGCGLDIKIPNNITHTSWGLGMLGMRERATAVGGQLFVESAPKQGTIIRAELPA